MALFICINLFLHRSSPRPDEIERVAAEIAPEDAEEFGIFAEPHAAAADSDDKGQGKAHQEIQKPDPQHAAEDGRQVPGV